MKTDIIKLVELKKKINKLDKYYLTNYGLVGINAIEKIIDIYLTYKGMELDPNFIEQNPIMRKIIHNKPLTYLVSAVYVGGLAGLNYLTHKIANYFKYKDMNKITTFGLGINILGNLFVILNNLNSLMILKRKRNI